MTTPEELYKRGAEFNNAGKCEQAYRCFIEAAERGDANAQNMVGRYLAEGLGGVEKDQRAAVEWYRKAAEKGQRFGQSNYADALWFGNGIDKDRVEAYRWFRKAAEQGYGYAQYMTGRCFEEGFSGKIDRAEAFRWFRKAADQGLARAQNTVGVYLQDGLGGVPKDLAEANDLFRKAAEQGVDVAQLNLAFNLHRGCGIPEDRAEAYRWFRKAAEQGIDEAQNMVGRYLDEGWGGIEKDQVSAVEWYRKAANQGQRFGQSNYADALWFGSGIEQDRAEAYLWYLKAAEQGYGYAQYMTGRCLEEGWQGAIDLAAAATWYRKAADQGREDAKAALKRILEKKTSSTQSECDCSADTSMVSTASEEPEEELERLLEELDTLTGLEGVKREIRRRVASVRLSKIRGDSSVHGSLHMVFSGSPGTGKTTVARLVGKIYHALGLLNDGDLFVECSREDLVGRYVGQTAPKVKDQVEKALGGILFIDEAYALYKPESENDFGREAIDTLVKAMEDHRDDLVVIMAGYTDKMQEMIRYANPGLASRFRTWVEFEDYTADELMDIATKMIASRNRKLGKEADRALHELITERFRDLEFGNARGVRNLLDDIQDAADERLAARISSSGMLDADELMRIERADVEKLFGSADIGQKKAETLDALLEELDSLTGLSSAKRVIRIRVAEVKHAERARAVGASIDARASSHHMVFAGNPGTGKTTVARLVGRIYYALGIVRDPRRLIECKREDLVGRYLGETAPKVKKQVEKALGGILFIDEAYSLYKPGSDADYGSEAIDALVALMEDHRDDLIVIIAGYRNEMKEMMRYANPGLMSRFRTWVDFEDYTIDELVDIFEHMVEHRGLHLDQECREVVAEVIAARIGEDDFGNARGVRNLLDDAVEQQILRLAKEGDAAECEGRELSRSDYETIRAVDIPSVHKPQQKMKFGFI